MVVLQTIWKLNNKIHADYTNGDITQFISSNSSEMKDASQRKVMKYKINKNRKTMILKTQRVPLKDGPQLEKIFLSICDTEEFKLVCKLNMYIENNICQKKFTKQIRLT